MRDIHRVVLPDGQTRDIRADRRQEIYTHRGEPNLVGVVRDITDELRQAQSAMQRDAPSKWPPPNANFCHGSAMNCAPRSTPFSVLLSCWKSTGTPLCRRTSSNRWP